MILGASLGYYSLIETIQRTQDTIYVGSAANPPQKHVAAIIAAIHVIGTV